MLPMSKWLGGAVALLWLAAATSWSVSQAKEEPAQLPLALPGGVADPPGKTGYVTGAKGEIDAIDLENGRLLWQTSEASRPLVAFDKRVAAQATGQDKPNSFSIVILDGEKKGKPLLRSDPVVFPDWVQVNPSYGHSFACEGWVDKGSLFLRWEAHASYAGGAAPAPEIEEAARKNASGVARMDLKNGHVEMLDQAPVTTSVKLPPELAKLTSQQYWTGTSWQTQPLVVGNTVAVLAREGGGAQDQTLVLKMWDLHSGKARASVELLKGKELWPQVQPDGRYLFVHKALPKEALPPGDYAWWLFSTETGKQVAKLPYDASGHNMVVIGSHVYSMVAGPGKGPGGPAFGILPRSLRAIDLKTGKMAWERPIEPVHHMPPPP